MNAPTLALPADRFDDPEYCEQMLHDLFRPLLYIHSEQLHQQILRSLDTDSCAALFYAATENRGDYEAFCNTVRLVARKSKAAGLVRQQPGRPRKIERVDWSSAVQQDLF